MFFKVVINVKNKKDKTVKYKFVADCCIFLLAKIENYT